MGVNKKKEGFTNIIVGLSLEVFAGFFPAFYILETNLKRRLYNQIKNKKGDNWFADQLQSRNTLFTEERDYILRRKPKNFKLKEEGLLVESGLGFWIEFFNKEIYKETKGAPIGIFNNLPTEVKRKAVYKKLDSIREFKNLMAHSRLSLVISKSDLNMLAMLRIYPNDLETVLNWFGGLPVEAAKLPELETKIERLEEMVKEG